MHSTSDNTEIMINDKVDDVIKWLFESLPSRYQISLGSYTDSPDWIKIKKAIINPV